MPILAGEVVTAARLNRLQPVTYHADATAAVGPSVTDADITGATITLTTQTNNAIFVATGDYDFDYSGAATALEQGKLVVDGSIQAGTANCQDGTATTNDRRTHSRTWRGTLATAGSHTLKLTCTLGSGITVNATHTGITVTIYEVV